MFYMMFSLERITINWIQLLMASICIHSIHRLVHTRHKHTHTHSLPHCTVHRTVRFRHCVHCSLARLFYSHTHTDTFIVQQIQRSKSTQTQHSIRAVLYPICIWYRSWYTIHFFVAVVVFIVIIIFHLWTIHRRIIFAIILWSLFIADDMWQDIFQLIVWWWWWWWWSWWGKIYMCIWIWYHGVLI